MSTNVGAIDFELLLNSNPFNKGLKSASNNVKSSGIESSLKSIGKAAIAAFSVKAVVDFTKECLKLGSNLSEVQNVVDVTFGNLNGEVDKFAQNAITQFGLGQTVTKKYVGTFGAMAKAFDFNNQEALKMSETLTGLTGDVASFYNVSSDEAFTKLKSVFTGETETLKDLGIVMTQTALDQYAMANGFGKTTSAMTEQEKTALRYQFVVDKLSLAQGDFARTSDSWANQTRVLSLRFDELKATLGQGFINLFTPIVKGINWVISKLQVLADAFKSFTEFITGKKADSSNGIGSVASDLTSVTDSADTASDAVSGIGSSAKKAAKEMKNLASFDTANILKTNSSDSSSNNSPTSGNTNVEGGNFDFGNLNSSTNIIGENLDIIKNKFLELKDLFLKGLNISFGKTNFNAILAHLSRIKDSFVSIWTDKKVLNSVNTFANTFTYSFGQVLGAVGRIGINIAEGLIGSIDNYLNQNSQRLSEHISAMFDITSKDLKLTGELWKAYGEISDIFSSNSAKQIGANIIAMFTNPIMSVLEFISKFAVDLRAVFVQPIIDNAQLIKESIGNTLAPIETITGTIAECFTYIGDKLNEVYDNSIGPFLESFKTGISDSFSKFLELYNQYVVPVLDVLAENFSALWEQHLKPLVDQIGNFLSSIFNALTLLWNTLLKPLIDWIIQTIIPVLAPIFQTIGTVIMQVFGTISDVISGVFEIFSGLINFIIGVFTGDWSKAWEGIKSIFEGIWTAIKGIVETIWNLISGIISVAVDIIVAIISTAFNLIKSIITTILNAIKSVVSTIWNAIKTIISTIVNTIANTISGVFNGIKNTISTIFNAIKTVVTNVWNGIWGVIKGVINAILGGIESFVNGIINGINFVLGGISDVANAVGSLIGLDPISLRLSTISLPRLAEGGYAKANSPQLAIIGDNRHEGEIVAPEGKLEDIYRKILKEQGNGNNEKVIQLLNKIIQLLESLNFDFNLYLDGYELLKRIEKIKKKKNFAKNGG